MTFSNEAAWLDAKDTSLRVGPAETYKPSQGEVLIEIHAIAINPVDWAQQSQGLFIQNYPDLIGCDAAGVIVELGEGVTNLSVGTRVLAQMAGTEGQSRAAFQKYAVAPEVLVSRIPDEVSFAEASVIPIAYLTSIAGLYQKELLGLPLPELNPKQTGKTVLIWGGATSVACMAIQLAVASGVEVITTASAHNFEYCKSLGAKEIFDYKSDTVVQDLVTSLNGKDLVGVYEASGMDDAMKNSVDILSALGGGFMAPARFPPENLPPNVKAKWIHCLEYKTGAPEDLRYLWQDFLPAALKSGQFKSAPTVQIAGHGLGSVQAGIDAWKAGVSAKKIVVDKIN